MSNETDTQRLETALSEIDELQTKLAFQDHTIEELNEALTSQQQQIDKLSFQVRHLMGKIKSMAPSNVAKMSEETPPPHY